MSSINKKYFLIFLAEAQRRREAEGQRKIRNILIYLLEKSLITGQNIQGEGEK